MGGILVGVLTIAIGFFFYFSGRVYPGVFVAGVNLGGKTIGESAILLEEKLATRLPKTITFLYEGRNWDIPLATIGGTIDYQKTAERSFSYGRKGTVVGNLEAIGRAMITNVSLPPAVAINESDLHNRLLAIASEVDIPTQEPSVSVDSTKSVLIISGKDGRIVQIAQAQDRLKERLSSLSSEPLMLPVQALPVKISQREEEHTRRRALSLLTKSVEFTLDGTTATVTSDEIISLLSFDGGYDSEKIASLAARLGSKVERPPQDAVFQFEGGKVTVFKAAIEGVTLNKEEAMSKIMERFLSLEATTSSSQTATLPLKSLPPKITTAEVNNLGIKELIGRGISYFRGSIPNRVHNIVLASSHVNGTLVPPGETFSFAKAVGDISAATGYQQAYIIENGRTVLGDGGGTCQVSTTLFRAALNSGLPIEERHAHAYRVYYYEQGGWSAGFDATVFVPNVDLKFKNDTPAHILVQAIPDIKNYTLTFELYGTKDGRIATTSKGRVWNVVPAPPDRYQDDPTLPKGVVKQVDFSAAGAKAAFDYEVVRGDQILQKRTFASNFRPWQAVFLRGTKE